MCAKKRISMRRKGGASVLAKNRHIKTGGGGFLDRADLLSARETVAQAKYIKAQRDSMSD